MKKEEANESRDRFVANLVQLFGRNRRWRSVEAFSEEIMAFQSSLSQEEKSLYHFNFTASTIPNARREGKHLNVGARKLICDFLIKNNVVPSEYNLHPIGDEFLDTVARHFVGEHLLMYDMNADPPDGKQDFFNSRKVVVEEATTDQSEINGRFVSYGYENERPDGEEFEGHVTIRVGERDNSSVLMVMTEPGRPVAPAAMLVRCIEIGREHVWHGVAIGFDGDDRSGPIATRVLGIPFSWLCGREFKCVSPSEEDFGPSAFKMVSQYLRRELTNSDVPILKAPSSIVGKSGKNRDLSRHASNLKKALREKFRSN